jgi:hypothetical protein
VKTKLVLAVGLIVLVAAMSGFGQQSWVTLKATIDFPFTVEKTVLPAGAYEFTRDNVTDLFKVKGPDNKTVLALCLSRLSKDIHTSAEDAHIVFDKVGDTYFLSEIWIPGAADGYLFLATKGPHTHIALNIKR